LEESYLFIASVVIAGYDRWRIDEAKTLLHPSAERKDKEKFGGLRMRLLKAIPSASAGGLTQIDPIGGAVAGSLKPRAVDQSF
jgi:hypothetical protein